MAKQMFGQWHKSSRSIGGNDNCVEVSVSTDGRAVGVRDSWDAGGPILVFTPLAWSRFAAAPPAPDPR
ncbi:DUF397 domain-containing protein [Plantactinospora sp. CA-290183]|uniref:DUF397 domain-containing protein n=1 Tax=Plantactinospora sp. CA-290183 TaxID=3240006 RepID=UPI003D8E6646